MPANSCPDSYMQPGRKSQFVVASPRE
uniref:Uncharacterized protein n=1 Tax=Anguilla anguilla TaxID=7936 RepID=A0A0E9P536_ANGAN